MAEQYIQAFKEHIEAAGLNPGEILADGAFHRCGVTGKERGKDGVYRLHSDPPVSGYYCNHTTGETGTWTAAAKEKMSSDDRERLQARIKKDREEAARRLEEERSETARSAKQLYDSAEEVASHPYLAAKGADVVPGLRVTGEILLVPRMNLQGELVSMVRIWPDGSKKNIPGATWPGGFFPIEGADGPLLVCEGVSTGISLYMATGWTVLCAFECGNLEAVAAGAREAYPERESIVCADNDGATKGNPGVTAATKAARRIGARLAVPEAPGKGKADFNDLHMELGLDQVREQIEAARAPEAKPGAWERAVEIFPRVSPPWNRFPASLARSWKQLARSCASSPVPLPGAALAIICGAVGNTVAVSPKRSWNEPLVLYYADIRESGDGKTAPLWALAAPLIKRQEAENKRAEAEQQEYDNLSKKEQKEAQKPRPARGLFATGLTLEGLRQDLTGNPTGGTVIILSELSSFISSQNQYKGGGDDRESWLCLHDGKPARVVRAGGKTAYIRGARPQVIGGVQPEIFIKAFTSQDGTFLRDGTTFRLLVTHEPSAHFELTGESWTDENRELWERIVERALEWADERTATDEGFDFNESGGPHRLQLSEDAQQLFFDWRNDLSAKKHDLPVLVRGHLPKIFGYALRLAGALHLVKQFGKDEEPRKILAMEDMQAGIDLAQFFAGQAVSALRLLQEDEEVTVQEVSERTRALAWVLQSLRPQVDSGRLAVGLIQETFNEAVSPEEQFATARAMGAFLRSLGLTISPGKHRANGRSGVHCLEWDRKVEDFVEDIEDIDFQCQQPESPVNTGSEEVVDIEDIPDEVII